MLMVTLFLPLRVYPSLYGESNMPVVEFEGQQYDFPEDATQDEMTAALSSIPKAEEEIAPEDATEPLREQAIIKKDEGVRKNEEGQHISYTDRKVITGGVGHQLTKEELKQYPVGTTIPDDVVAAWFTTDMDEANTLITELLEEHSVHVPDEVFDVLTNMVFTLGKRGLNNFNAMWAAIEIGDWKTAADEMEDSAWSGQVGNRAVRLIARMAAIPSNVQEEAEAAPTDTLTPAKGGLFEDENGKLFMVDDEGNKKEV